MRIVMHGQHESEPWAAPVEPGRSRRRGLFQVPRFRSTLNNRLVAFSCLTEDKSWYLSLINLHILALRSHYVVVHRRIGIEKGISGGNEAHNWRRGTKETKKTKLFVKGQSHCQRARHG